MKLLRIGAETSEARVDVSVDDDVGPQRAVEQVAHIDNVLVTRGRMKESVFFGMCAAQQLAAQGGSAFDRLVQSLDDQGAIGGARLDAEQAQSAVDDGQQIAEVMGIGLGRVSFDPRARVVWKANCGVPAEYARDSPVRPKQRDLDPREARRGELGLPVDQ